MPTPFIDKINTPEMLASTMDRDQHKANAFLRMLSFGAMAGNDAITVLDMSYWQDHTRINYDLLCNSVEGFILRASYGIWKDTRVDIHYREIHKRGKPIGFYPYLVGNQSAQAQVDVFHDAIADKVRKLQNWADVEDRRPGTALTRQVVDSFLDKADTKFNERTEVYTGPYAWKEIMRTGGHGHRRLWVANYGVNSPALPIGGDWDTWWLWQHTSSGRQPGYYGNLDMNRFNGTKEQWDRWVGGANPSPLTREEQHDLMWNHLRKDLGY